ncbi:MAG: TIGR00159 family protein [Acholeplasmataceae bacterium]|nr:TIGR00159 family protein [Acholeplasmataceae bacterium]
MVFDEIRKQLSDYTDQWSALGIIRLCVDLTLLVVTLFFIYRLVRARVKGYKLIIILLLFGLFYLVVFVFQLTMYKTFLDLLIFWCFGFVIMAYSQEIKHSLESIFTPNKGASEYATKQEKKEIISTLIATADFLSKRRIGALITIEREDNLNTYIDKAIEIKSAVTQELLTTIFTPGTACHDGAVIIRKNRLMCAGAYFPSTDRYDVPKSLGTRHRAAIGISERTDSLTIVVSEESGNISVAIDGIINLKISLERLEEMLDRYIINK